MRNNHSALAATSLMIPFFLGACGQQDPNPTKPQITSLQTENVNATTHVIHIPGMNPDEATYRDHNEIKAFSFMVAQTTRTINPEAATEASAALEDSGKQKTEENIFIFFADGKTPYSTQTIRIEPGTYITNFNGDASHPSVQVLFLTSGKAGFRAFMIENCELAPPIAAPAQTLTRDDNSPSFDMSNPAHPLHPTNPLNPMNPSGYFAPSPGPSGGK